MEGKKYVKTNIVGFVIGILIISGVVVYATVFFPSNEVTYDNGTSGLESNNVQGAIDELYEVCTAKSLGEQIIEDNGLEKDSYECRYFFIGADPNNYITFNGESAGWRIISVECDGSIKIMRQNSIGQQAWDTSNSSNWARPATLNTYLNGTYYDNLNETSKEYIIAKNFGIGGITWEDQTLSNTINSENSTIWNGKIALPTVSEYIRTNSNSNSCGSFYLNQNNYQTCKNTTWMYIDSINDWWLLSPDTRYTNRVNNGGQYGFLTYANLQVKISGPVRPALYLSSDIKITGGDGSQSNPYQIQ